MHPVLFRFGPLTLYSYGAFLALAFVASSALAVFFADRRPNAAVLRGAAIVDLVSWGMLGGVLGGRLFFAALNGPVFLAAPLEFFAIWHGGLVWYGGFIGCAVAAFVYLRRNRISFLKVADQLVPFLALGHAVGRIGCFFNGCCHGRPTAAWWGVSSSLAPTRVVPVQLFESGLLALLCALLLWGQAGGRFRGPGMILGQYLMGYGTIRFVLEYFRGDQSLWIAGMTLQQGVSVAVACAGVALLLRGACSRES